MAAVTLKKGQITIPSEVRSKLGMVDGDQLDLEVRSNCVVLKPHPVDEPTVAQRKIIDAKLTEGLEDVKQGRLHGPFDSIQALEKSLRQVGAKSRSPRTR